jgi:hypothetical protein
LIHEIPSAMPDPGWAKALYTKVSVPERGFVALIHFENWTINMLKWAVSVPERGFVALIPSPVQEAKPRPRNSRFQSPSGDSWL